MLDYKLNLSQLCGHCKHMDMYTSIRNIKKEVKVIQYCSKRAVKAGALEFMYSSNFAKLYNMINNFHGKYLLKIILATCHFIMSMYHNLFNYQSVSRLVDSVFKNYKCRH